MLAYGAASVKKEKDLQRKEAAIKPILNTKLMKLSLICRYWQPLQVVT